MHQEVSATQRYQMLLVVNGTCSESVVQAATSPKGAFELAARACRERNGLTSRDSVMCQSMTQLPNPVLTF
jgi:hypothetical protein